MGRIFGLEFKVIAVLGFLVIIAASTIGFMAYALQQSRANQSISDRLSSLQALSQSVFRRSGNYIESAPRSYPDYNRDLVVYYPDFMADLAGIGDKIDAIHQAYFQRPPSVTLGGLHFGLRTVQTDEVVSGMRDSWQRFNDGLHRELGDDTNAPRLEWGTAFIRDNQQSLERVINQLIERLRQQLAEQVTVLQAASKLAMGALGALAAAGMLWFYFGVTRRIRKAVAGCVRVSTGDFGFQMPSAGRDEIGVLGRAINTLSSRARLILALMDRVRSASGPAEALQAVWDESERLFDLNWIGLFEITDDGRRMDLQQACPRHDVAWNRPLDLRTQHVLKDSLRLAEPWVFTDLTAFIHANPSERLVRDLFRRVDDTHAILTLPMMQGHEPRALLVMVSKRHDAFTTEHVRLLQNLSPLLGEAFRGRGQENADLSRMAEAGAVGGAVVS